MNNETIVAIATPLGQGGIGVIRLSGDKSIDILKNIFRTKKNIDLSTVSSHTIHYGRIYDVNNGSVPIDEVLVSIMFAPNTYTKEDVVEISSHASNIVLQRILEIILKNGARTAEPGEFTKRAFLNGRIDLSQAEAVIDLINAKTESASKSALKQLEGELSIYIKNTQHIMKEILMTIEANIDFPEDNITGIDTNNISDKLLDLTNSIKNLTDTFNQGKILKNGIGVALVGKTNVGKSSLFNKLIDLPSRSIVTNVPGTTRDYIEESVNIKGRLFRFIDTAGLKIPRGKIERESLKCTNERLNEADMVIFILDGSKIMSKKDLEIWKMISKKPNIICVNKMDLPQRLTSEKTTNIFGSKILHISCSENKGLEQIKDELIGMSSKLCNIKYNNDLIITNIRHRNILAEVVVCLKDAITAIKNNLPLELIATDIRHVLENLQEITGERITESILDDIFSKFCIGK